MKQRKLKTQKHSEDKINKNTRNIFRIKKENEAIKDRIIRDTRVGNFETTILLSIKAMMMEIRPYP